MDHQYIDILKRRQGQLQSLVEGGNYGDKVRDVEIGTLTKKEVFKILVEELEGSMLENIQDLVEEGKKFGNSVRELLLVGRICNSTSVDEERVYLQSEKIRALLGGVSPSDIEYIIQGGRHILQEGCLNKDAKHGIAKLREPKFSKFFSDLPRAPLVQLYQHKHGWEEALSLDLWLNDNKENITKSINLPRNQGILYRIKEDGLATIIRGVLKLLKVMHDNKLVHGNLSAQSIVVGTKLEVRLDNVSYRKGDLEDDFSALKAVIEHAIVGIKRAPDLKHFLDLLGNRNRSSLEIIYHHPCFWKRPHTVLHNIDQITLAYKKDRPNFEPQFVARAKSIPNVVITRWHSNTKQHPVYGRLYCNGEKYGEYHKGLKPLCLLRDCAHHAYKEAINPNLDDIEDKIWCLSPEYLAHLIEHFIFLPEIQVLLQD